MALIYAVEVWLITKNIHKESKQEVVSQTTYVFLLAFFSKEGTAKDGYCGNNAGYGNHPEDQHPYRASPKVGKM